MTRIPGRALLRAAHDQRFAVPAFNVSNLETIQGVLAAAEAAAAPVILQVSPGAIAYAGYATADPARRSSWPTMPRSTSSSISTTAGIRRSSSGPSPMATAR